MSFMILCHDHPGQHDVRLANRAAHLAYIKGFMDKLRLAGPILDADGGMAGSLLVMDFDTRAEADAFCAGDPYGKAGLFASVEIRGFKPVLPR